MRHVPPACVLGLLVLLCGGMVAGAAERKAPRFETVLYGASFYEEYMPHDRLDQDVELMQKAGVTVVRLGESTWSSFEPRDGVFEFAWMDRVLDRLHRAGIKVILGTPTYSIPPWLYKEHPEIQLLKLGDVQRMPYGLRQQVELSHPVFRRYAERIIRQVVGHFRNHPAVIGYQVDNETEPRDMAGPGVQALFLDRLKRKFGTVDALNKAWGFVYWGQLLGDWSELPPREGTRNPGYKLEWARHLQDTVTDFLAWEVGIVDELRRDDQFVTHNFVGGLRPNIDEYAIASHLDVTGVNPYYPVQDELDGFAIELSGNLCRSLKGRNYLVTETNAQTIGWDSKAQYPPYDGQLRLNAYSHVSTGANMVSYWHWHSLHYGQETYWKGVLGHDLEPNRVYREMARVGAELKRIGPRLVNLQRKSRVAILYSTDSYHALQAMPFDDRVDYDVVVEQMARALYDLNVPFDFVFPASPSFSSYDVLVVPALYVADDALLGRLAAYVKAGGHLLLTFKSGFCDENSTVRWSRMPGPLRAAAGFSYQEFTSLRSPIPLKDDPFGAGDGNRTSIWAEMIEPEGAQVLARYDDPFLARYAAITRNRFGKGTLTYEGTYLSSSLQERVLTDVLAERGLVGADQQLPPRVHVRHATGADGRPLLFVFNYSAAPVTVSWAWAAGTDLLTDRPVEKSALVTIGPWDLVIVQQ